jgi:flagellar biosynthesis protein FliR
MNSLEQVFAEIGFKTNLSLVILTVALIAARVIPVIVMSPFMGGEAVPAEVKIGVGVMLSAVLFPAVSERVSQVPLQALPFIATLCKEIFIGISLAFVVSLVFDAARVAGNIVDTMSGASMAQVMVPMLQQQSTIYATFKVMLAVTLFLTLNGHHLIIEALADSLILIPVDQFPQFSHGMWGFFDLVLRTFADMLKIGLALVAPGMIATFVTDMAMGMINRVAPQVQVFFISMMVKPLAAALVVMLGVHMILTRMNEEFEHMLKMLNDAIRLLT